MPFRPRRSVLYVPGANPRALDKARSLPADALILDLEDAVAPDAKCRARDHVVTAVQQGGHGGREILVRVNGLKTPWGRDDLAAVAELEVHGVLFPKIESSEQVLAAVEALDEVGMRRDLPVWIMAETPRGALHIDQIVGSSPRLAGIIMGTSDLAKALRVPHAPGRPGLVTALGLCILAARAHGLDIVDGVHLDLEDDAGFRAACEQGRELGFDGKTVIHPRQIAAANEVFAPSPAEVESAGRIIAAWEQARRAGLGVVVVDGKLVESLHVEEARRLLTMAEAIQNR